jgi:hypothetical protein
MKIGYLKFSMNMEIDFTKGKIGNIEGRATLFKAIIDAGHNLTLYSQVTMHEEKILLDPNTNYDNEYGVDNSWFDSINYEPDQLINANTDLLIIENGPDNLLFKTRFPKFDDPEGENQTFIRRCAEAVDSYEGVVFFLNIHPDVPFPLKKMANSEVDFHDKENVYLNNEGSKPEHGWASHKEFYKNKKLVFFNQAHDTEKYLDLFDGKRQGYREAGVKTYRLPILFGRWLLPEKIRNRGYGKLKTYETVYMGYPRYREKEFEYYFFKLAKQAKIDTWGPWDKKANKEFKEKTIEANISVHGFLPAQIMCTEIYNKSLVSIGLISKKLQQCGWVTHRTLETIHSGCILLGIRNAIGINEYIDSEFLVSGRKEFRFFVDKILGLNQKVRRALWTRQFEKIKKYDGEYMLNYLLKIYNKERRS